MHSRFASRSRAYVETERVLDKEIVRHELHRQQRVFEEQNDDIDDAARTIPIGFARFNGPDRAEAIAHHNVSKLVDAAFELEKTPQPEPSKVIPNEQANALFILASVSADRPQEAVVKDEQQPQPKIALPQITIPAPQVTLNRAASPLEPVSSTPPLVTSEPPKRVVPPS